MFSTRLDWSHPRNEITKLIERKRAGGAQILDLTETNPTRAGLAYDQDAILAALGDPRAVRYQPSAFGLLEAREAVARYYAGRGCGVDPRHLVLTASTSEAYSYLFKLLCRPGDEVLVPRPSYPLFEHLAALDNVCVRQYPLLYHEGWWLDADSLGAAITERTRAIIVVNPNNPTGSYVKQAEYRQMARLCTEHNLALIVDEVFADYSLVSDSSRAGIFGDCGELPLVFVLNGLSKLIGLPQMKLGWIAAGGARREEALAKLEWIADTYLSVSAPVQHAAPQWLDLAAGFQQRLRDRLLENLGTARAALDLLRVEGGWSAIFRMPRTLTEEQWALTLLGESGVLIQPGFFFDFEEEAYGVVSLLTGPEIFREGVARIARTLADSGGIGQ